MLTQSLNTSVVSNKIAPVSYPVSDQFGAITGHVGLVASEFTYKKDEEIYGEDEPADARCAGGRVGGPRGRPLLVTTPVPAHAGPRGARGPRTCPSSVRRRRPRRSR